MKAVLKYLLRLLKLGFETAFITMVASFIGTIIYLFWEDIEGFLSQLKGG